MAIDFDEIIDRRNSHSNKWDDMEQVYGVSPDDGLAMWVADTDFKPPSAVNEAVANLAAHGVHGYYDKPDSFNKAVIRWMQRHHNWLVKPEEITPVHGLGAAIALCVQAFTEKSDSVIIFTPVYHSFARYIKANQRTVVESEMINTGGRYTLDLDALQSSLSGQEKMMIFCSPHNPGGRVWDVKELQNVADFCIRNDLVLVSDEIHHDIVYAGHKHTPMPIAAANISNRLAMLVAPSKTFNLAGGVTGCVVISDLDLSNRFRSASSANSYTKNRYGMTMAETAYNNGSEYVTALVEYLAENHRIFDNAINKIPGVRSMKLESTFLAWVDFSGTGMPMDEIQNRVEKQAKIAANHGGSFGKGGENFLRFNLGCRREMVIDAIERLEKAFQDLQ